jgi:hypothetical protein
LLLATKLKGEIMRSSFRCIAGMHPQCPNPDTCGCECHIKRGYFGAVMRKPADGSPWSVGEDGIEITSLPARDWLYALAYAQLSQSMGNPYPGPMHPRPGLRLIKAIEIEEDTPERGAFRIDFHDGAQRRFERRESQ